MQFGLLLIAGNMAPELFVLGQQMLDVVRN